jgi:hypothetical protein
VALLCGWCAASQLSSVVAMMAPTTCLASVTTVALSRIGGISSDVALDETRTDLPANIVLAQDLPNALDAHDADALVELAFPDLVRRVVGRAAPALGNEPDAEGIPAGSVLTIPAHARAASHVL